VGVSTCTTRSRRAQFTAVGAAHVTPPPGQLISCLIFDF
jgi:hypothetical protein